MECLFTVSYKPSLFFHDLSLIHGEFISFICLFKKKTSSAFCVSVAVDCCLLLLLSLQFDFIRIFAVKSLSFLLTFSPNISIFCCSLYRSSLGICRYLLFSSHTHIFLVRLAWHCSLWLFYLYASCEPWLSHTPRPTKKAPQFSHSLQIPWNTHTILRLPFIRLLIVPHLLRSSILPILPIFCHSV